MRIIARLSLLGCLLLLPQGLMLSSARPVPPSGYHLLKKITLGGEGGWDYLTLDAKTRRLYISRSTHVMVVDADTGKLLGDIPATPGVHGIALVPELGRGFTSNGRDNSVTVFDLGTLKALKRIPVGQNPDAIIYDSATKRIFTMNGTSRDTTAIDAKTETVAGTLALGGRPESAAGDERGRLFINIEDKSEVVAVDARKLSIQARWPLAPGAEPTGMAIDRQHKRLFVGCSNKLMAVLDTEQGRVLTTLPIGSGVDAIAFEADTGLAFSSNGDGTVTVVHEDSPAKFTVLENAPTQRGARTMALDAQQHQIFLVTAEFGPPPPATPERPRPRPTPVPGTFTLLVLGR